jgi:hypothetical protein
MEMTRKMFTNGNDSQLRLQTAMTRNKLTKGNDTQKVYKW